MPLTSSKAVEQAKILHGYHLSERSQLDLLRRYWKGRQRLPAVIPTDSPNEVKVMSRSSRVNMMPIVVNSLVQSMFVDGFRSGDDGEDLEVWRAWQANRMDKRQSGIHRATAGYGTAYAVVLPGDPVPVIRGASPRQMTTLYGEDPDWPIWALERLGHGLWKLYDDQAIYYLSGKSNAGEVTWEHIETREHNMGVTPVVRYLDEEDLDADDEVSPDRVAFGEQVVPAFGQVSPLMALQDQIDLTTLGLQIAQHYGAFRQRYIIGWVAETEAQKMKASAAKLWTFDEDPESLKVGEFSQTNIDGFIKSREASLRHAATLSQTPVHELIGELVNLSAEALAAAEAGKDRKVDERKTNSGESHEQTMLLVGRLMGVEIPEDAQVVWRDTSARSFAATVDALGKLSQMLGVPPQELWERIPNTSRQDVERWKTAAGEGDAFANLAAMLDRQANGDGSPVPAE